MVMRTLAPVLVTFLAIGSVAGIVGGLAMIVSLFVHQGILAGIIGIILIPLTCLLFPVYFLLYQALWWPLLFYPICAMGIMGGALLARGKDS
jgi:hypothetical protein